MFHLVSGESIFGDERSYFLWCLNYQGKKRSRLLVWKENLKFEHFFLTPAEVIHGFFRKLYYRQE